MSLGFLLIELASLLAVSSIVYCSILYPTSTSDPHRTMSPPPFLKTVEEYRQLVDSVDTFLLDCDGVIYHGPVVVEGVKEVLNMFRAAGTFRLSPCHCAAECIGSCSFDSPGKKVIFVTNNASKSRRMYKSTFDKLGIEVKEVGIFLTPYHKPGVGR